MSPLFFRFALLLAIAIAAATAPARAGATALSAAEEQAVRQVIETQLEALAADDADRAFDTATPGVREAIGNSWRFLALVRGIYPMVYRPSFVAFLRPEEDDGTVLQLVQIVDNDDQSWLVLFALERQPDASWRISGCAVTENTWHAA
jgi:hypothetical protein